MTNFTTYFFHLTNVISIFSVIQHVIQNFILGTFILNYIYCVFLITRVIILHADTPESVTR